MKNEIYRKDGLLSEYGLICGYVQAGKNKELYKEGGVYHVRSGKHWESFDKLTDARKAFNKLKTN